MSETPNPFGLEPAAGAKRQVCANCNEDKPVVPGAWAFKPGGDPLKICLVCQTMRKAESKEAKENAGDKPKTPRAIRDDAKLDVAKALKTGASIANQYVDMVMARVLQYAADPTHKLHAWAIEFLAERIMPRKLYEELGGQAAGVGLADKRPQFVIQVLPAQATPDHGGRVIPGEVTTVELLPASTNEPTVK